MKYKKEIPLFFSFLTFSLLPVPPLPLPPSFIYPSSLTSLSFLSFLQTKKFKIPTIRTASRKPSRRGSTLSLTRTSGASSPQSSMMSMNPGSDEPPSVVTQASKDIEDNESWSTKQDEESLHISKSYLGSHQSAFLFVVFEPLLLYPQPLSAETQRSKASTTRLVQYLWVPFLDSPACPKRLKMSP